jgi:hypothetical protein
MHDVMQVTRTAHDFDFLFGGETWETNWIMEFTPAEDDR